MPGALISDFRYALRMFRRTPFPTAVAVATLALGIASTTAIFAVFDAVLLEPLPYSDPERRVMIWSRWKDFDKTWVSEAELFDYRRRASTLDQVAAWSHQQGNLTGDGEPLRVGLAQVTANTFSVLGSRPLLGRTFTELEDLPEAPRVAVLGHGLWQRRYGGDPSVLDRQIQLDGRSFAVVGVMPPGFQLPTDFNVTAAEPTQLFLPLAIDEKDLSRGSHGLYAAAELTPGSTADSATAELRSIAANLTREGQYPEAMQFTAFAVPVKEEILGGVRPALLLLLASVGFLLLIACANVANLLLAVSEGRHRELAVRTAIGATVSRLVRQLLTEGFVLATAAGALGLGLAYAFVRLAAAADPTVVPRASGIAVEPRLLVFTGAVSLATMLLFSFVPILRALSLDVSDSLKEGGARSGSGIARQAFRSGLVVFEMALSVALLIGAGLMLRSLEALQRIDVGFRPENVLTLRVSLPQASYETPEKVVAFYRESLDRVRGLPGVTEAGYLRSLPLAAPIGDWGLDVEGYAETPGNQAKGDWQVVSDGAIEALGERLVRGRSITRSDTTDSQPVVLVNETMARLYWKDGDPIGKRVRMGAREEPPWLTVVGIVGDLHHNGITGIIKEKFYVPHSQFHRSTGFSPGTMTLAVRTSADPLSLVGPIQSAIQSLDASLPVSSVRLMDDIVRDSMATTRYTSFLLGAFAAIALALAAIGIYGVLSHLVSQRVREIGIRMAMGAGRREVVRLVLGRGLLLSLAGIVVGIGAAFAITRTMAALLHGVGPTDPITFLLVPLLLMAVALVASAAPALRATRVDPVVALRAE